MENGKLTPLIAWNIFSGGICASLPKFTVNRRVLQMEEMQKNCVGPKFMFLQWSCILDLAVSLK